MQCHDGVCFEGREQAPTQANFAHQFEMPMMPMPTMFAPAIPSFGNLERRMQNEFGDVESRIRHDMQDMDDSFARIEHNIGDNLRNLDKLPKQGDAHSESFSMSSESSMGADGKMHQHAQKNGATTSCFQGECHKITCSNGECEEKVFDEATGKELTEKDFMEKEL